MTEPMLEQQERELECIKSRYVSQQQRLSLDYNRLASVKKIELLEGFLSLMYAQYAFHHQAFSSLRDFEPAMRSLGEHIAQIRHQAEDCISEAENLVVTPRANSGTSQIARSGSLDDAGGYMQVGQQDDDGPSVSVQSMVDADDMAEVKTAAGDSEVTPPPGFTLSTPPASTQATSTKEATRCTEPSLSSLSLHTSSQTHQRKASRSERLSLASISLSPHGLFQISGYLFLRSQYSLMTSWQRRWFEISEGSLIHFQRDDERDKEIVPLHLCMVKRGVVQDNRRNVFELIAPNRTYVLQAESTNELNAWKACLKQSIEASLYSHTPLVPTGGSISRTSTQLMSSDPTSPATAGTKGDLHVVLSSQQNSTGIGSMAAATVESTKDVQAMRMKKMRHPVGNGQCVDCGQASPEWAAINLGALMCIECSGIHRSLGVHVSKVRSVKLDNWEPELMQVMQRLGNACVNSIYEAIPPGPDDSEKPNPQSSREQKQPYLELKYAKRRFIASKDNSPDAIGAKLVRAAAMADLPLALAALAQGASANAHDPESGLTPLIEAVGMGDFGMLELLFLWGADVNMRAKITATAYMNDSSKTSEQQTSEVMEGPHRQGSDDSGSSSCVVGGTALHLATRLGNVRVVWYLIRKGAQWDTPDAYGLLPLDIALENSNVQVVMALRYAAFQKASGLPPGTLGSKRPYNGGPAVESLDMLDMDDSFIRDWAIPPYSPYIDDSEEIKARTDNKPSIESTKSASSVAPAADVEGDADFGELQTASNT
ncbi:ArfGap-domain-containing protein [Coemansia reversa NRRL 1564]|uniref:ArfGap-domain-containing protein n=1 Tax=Coemansia reversa (strain ATCC 12441 / NRRL 1564) TaxID=763665 RepID=A0A2G5B9V4_COERN|nr:ArfGap-domain-containing protein [Coemansia reversa NRRL 1564]|eukprot:PIA15795.1 ArfGap-domain-containing protein [Coemansia reversa NRRL 1564]